MPVCDQVIVIVLSESSLLPTQTSPRGLLRFFSIMTHALFFFWNRQTSADVSNVANFKLPNPCGRSGGL
jgi:hypothetical protein